MQSIQTCPYLSKPVQTYPNLSKTVQTCPNCQNLSNLRNLSKPVQTCWNLTKPVQTIQTCRNLSKTLKPVQTCLILSEPVETCLNLSKPVLTCLNLYMPVQTCPYLSKRVQTCQNVSKPVQTCQNLSKPVQTCLTGSLDWKVISVLLQLKFFFLLQIKNDYKRYRFCYESGNFLPIIKDCFPYIPYPCHYYLQLLLFFTHYLPVYQNWFLWHKIFQNVLKRSWWCHPAHKLAY